MTDLTKHPRRASLAGAVRWDSAVGALLLVLLICSFSFVDNFGNALNISFLIGNTLPIALIALPMTMLVVSGEVDLSVGSTAGLSGAVMGALWNQGMAIETIIPLCLLLGVVCGLVNGLLVTRLGLPSLAVTIGTMAAYRGIAQIVLGSDSVTDFPTQYLDFGAGRIGDTFIPYALFPFVVLLGVAIVVLHATPVGRSLFAIGASEEAARFAGIRVKRLKLSMFVSTGVLSALTGVFWALHYASARYDNATGLELSVIAAVLLGGIDFDGGKGTLGGAIAGVFLLGTLQNAMSLLNVSAQSQIVVTGVLLVISVLAPRVGRQIAQARARRRISAAAPPPPVTVTP
ncbi:MULTISPECIES: ABC transporter permease [unclassified Streptomyces]|uniref:ABC transporter permease n=1 Tax=unclassified Streptomyces TaxID=2593676 RepID=UPI002DD97BC3|nr:MULTISPECIES: ABC transporter permease [unclassified Streptomyces]WSF82646.1 ABC transporter permease [Streptomyces sp. NBC_01744]WSC41098.1 ABC transporter permease [Streptomyces sp. NBC_01763]WSC49196.1 ABC transporter permease [Streptomyces sp. NBC_01762]WSC51798.1 ABC transporter permease [Streptomyces sp. NBC_01761]WSD28859.1 ABC transporter permease [Streptomyces sp. NBC_01751]